MRFSLHKKFLFILFGDLNWIFFKDLNAKKVTMENRISVLPDINMEVGGGNLGGWWRFWEVTSKVKALLQKTHNHLLLLHHLFF
ncbi:hypothetical protein ERO13_D06G176408v2 [Gossypium hirsutum]|uniref:Uncharacterized protein n=2 Tax=Gossypium TaxID=3633 RepID=A0A5D2UNG7_GOSMU|nr:hypothetical protein ERO13_D06G176408v2 [Gossypium hirsutum]TYH67954.1 hypothetical protein ES332_D06G225600v1 [Gossypium tomentosum]TYH67955.1 hypothetical protein ES332_D06G225600v1 [Gossypium tomentosum]TYI78395.1 hypothetical protein E1A91_D06G208800v1 [Gossypium mustelinum]